MTRFSLAALVSLVFAAGALAAEPTRLSPGPQLFLDDQLIASQSNLTRTVRPPPRLPDPVITGPEDQCFQPYVSVVRDPQTRRFRMWYGVPAKEGENNPSHLAYIESEDGVHWIRPHKVLADPGGLEIRFGCSVIDDGPDFADPAKRFKYGWYWGGVNDPPTGGLMVATSPDGITWTPVTSKPPVLGHTHDINNIWRDTIRNKYMATVNMLVPEPAWKNQKRRRTFMSSSDDLVHWEKPYEVIPPDEKDEGEFQYYGMSGYLRRGDLYIGLIKVLRNELPAEPGGEAHGIGYTALAWTHDGKTWQRERNPFMPRNDKPDTFDRAMTWADCQLPVGDEVFIYYGAYAHGHKVERFKERQIGLARMKRDRYVSRDADSTAEGRLRTPVLVLEGSKLTVNADVTGEMRVAVLDADGKPIDGFSAGDCTPVRGDSVAHELQWKRPLSGLRGTPVQLQFTMRDGRLYAFEVGS